MVEPKGDNDAGHACSNGANYSYAMESNAFESQISVTVLGPDYDQVADIADMVQEAVLSLSDHPATGVAIVIADSEPLRIAPHNPSGVEQISATYTLTVRGDRGQ